MDKIENKIAISIGNMISQLYKSLPKCKYVGVIKTFYNHKETKLWILEATATLVAK